MKENVIGTCGFMLNAGVQASARDEVTAWVTLGCTLAITIVTCGIQIYHLIRDRDNDKKRK